MQKNKSVIVFAQIWYIMVGSFLMSIFDMGYSQVSTTKVDQYLSGNEKKFEMIVHIWGEVKNPGEYRVSDDTNILELISKAGGPTEYSNLKKIMLTREVTRMAQLSAVTHKTDAFSDGNEKKLSKRVVQFNLAHYLVNQQYEDLPILQPGDVIYIKRNSWFRWQTAIRLASQFALILQAIYYFSRIDY